MTALLNNLLNDEAGFIVSAELVLIATLGVLAMVVGLSEVAFNINNELQDVARAFVDALGNAKTIGEIYPLGGPTAITWPQMHHICSEAITGKSRLVVPLPAWYAKMVAAITPAALLPFNRDQVIMSQEDNTCDMRKFTDDFGWETHPFEESVKGYAGQL